MSTNYEKKVSVINLHNGLVSLYKGENVDMEKVVSDVIEKYELTVSVNDFMLTYIPAFVSTSVKSVKSETEKTAKGNFKTDHYIRFFKVRTIASMNHALLATANICPTEKVDVPEKKEKAKKEKKVLTPDERHYQTYKTVMSSLGENVLDFDAWKKLTESKKVA